MLKILSLGAGVQSSTLLLMACNGEIEKPDAAIFSDTIGEPDDVYDHLDFLKSEAEKSGIPLYVVSNGDLKKDFEDFISGNTSRASMIPAHTLTSDNAPAGLLGRQCTVDYKIMPVRRKMRQIMKERDEKSVELWIGISLDELQRMSDSPVKYITHRWPLIELRISRGDCIEWYNGKEYPAPPKSACYYCPFHSNSEWRRIKEHYPDLWVKSVEFDEKIRNIPGVKNSAFLHKSRVPLRYAILEDEDPNQISLFQEDCGGMCGV